MAKLIIGLTGGIGSGKTTVANMFAKYGIDIVDADIVAREVVAPGSQALNDIANHFGHDFILPDGNLDRAKLRQRVFSNHDDKTWLNALLHPLIREQMQLQCKQAKSAYCLLVAPLLIENGINRNVDKVLVVDVSPETQVARTTSRDNNSPAQVKRIMAAQANRDHRLIHADFVIDNNDSNLQSVENQVELLHRQFLKLVAELEI
ncbi:dephospho-CoA kinase [Thalassotalea maritima]|uniref:dephospho-CoA kinase n=1 Tax=Thalassotalea maritima TaxID=3242416 RepID=UPI0035271124